MAISPALPGPVLSAVIFEPPRIVTDSEAAMEIWPPVPSDDEVLLIFVC